MYVVLEISTVCRFSLIVVKEFHFECELGGTLVGGQVNNGQNFVNVVKEQPPKMFFCRKFGQMQTQFRTLHKLM